MNFEISHNFNEICPQQKASLRMSIYKFTVSRDNEFTKDNKQ